MPQRDRLKELGIDIAALKGLALDSRLVEEGFLFAALKGEKLDGRTFIEAAIARGASTILTDTAYDAPQDVHVVISKNPRKDLSLIASRFSAPLPEKIIAVTGTNGKSSVVHFCEQLWKKEGTNGVMMGTLNSALTTPDQITLFKNLGRLKQEQGVTHVAMETSSHGLSQYRVDGIPFKVAAFTNFTQDHLDYHIDMDGYFSAKTRLFSEALPVSGAAVLNADVRSYPSLRDVCKRRGIRVISYGEQGKDLKLKKRKIEGVSQNITLEVMGKSFELSIPFVGAFQVMNMLCAAGCLIALGSDSTSIINALPTLEGVPGRLQHVSDPTNTYNGYVDYAHTPDALETVLKALRPHTNKRLICVFGCGGDRDTSKRSQMGEIAARLADIAIITDDNPRNEDSAIIRSQVETKISGAENVKNIAGRHNAIESAVNLMEEGDLLLLAGKGHEQGQIIKGEIHPFNDVTELSNTLKNKTKR